MERRDLPDGASTQGGPDTGDAPRADAGFRVAVTLFVCTTCRQQDADPAPAGARLAEAARAAAPPDIAVKGVRCLANCKRSLSAAIARDDGWTYVFGDLSPEAAPDLLAGARLLAEAPDGLMPWRGRPDSLKRGMVARIPPFTFSEES